MSLYKKILSDNNYNYLDDYFNKFVKKIIFDQDYEEKLLGIVSNGSIYHKVNSNQNVMNEFLKTQDFLINYLYRVKSIKIDDNTKVFFINYGDTELVYVIDNDTEKYTLLVGQPNLMYGKVKEEFNNLIKLGKLSDKVIVPLEYISNNNREAFITQYIYQARCIASYNDSYGSYIPEPNYRFVPFTDEGRYLVNKCMIANLVKLYDEKENLGLVSVKVGGGDFILDKVTDNIELTLENILNNMYLIAAREFVKIDFKDYLKLIREEFSKITYYSDIKDKDKRILINDKNRVSMSKDEIEDGIKLGLYLRK